MPCGRCRQLLFEHGGVGLLLDTGEGEEPAMMRDLLPAGVARSRGRPFDPLAECRLRTPQPPSTVVDLIRAKRDGQSLSDDAIDWLLDAYARGEVADEQIVGAADGDLLPRPVASGAARRGPTR